MTTTRIDFQYAANESTGPATFDQPQRVLVADGVRAACILPDQATSVRLFVLAGVGAENIPDDHRVVAVRFYVKANAIAGGSVPPVLQVVDATIFNDFEVHTVTAPPQSFGVTESVLHLTAPAAFGLYLTGADVKEAEFGGAFRFKNVTGDVEIVNQANVDAIWAEVDTEPTDSDGV